MLELLLPLDLTEIDMILSHTPASTSDPVHKGQAFQGQSDNLSVQCVRLGSIEALYAAKSLTYY